MGGSRGEPRRSPSLCVQSLILECVAVRYAVHDRIYIGFWHWRIARDRPKGKTRPQLGETQQPLDTIPRRRFFFNEVDIPKRSAVDYALGCDGDDGIFEVPLLACKSLVGVFPFPGRRAKRTRDRIRLGLRDSGSRAAGSSTPSPHPRPNKVPCAWASIPLGSRRSSGVRHTAQSDRSQLAVAVEPLTTGDSSRSSATSTRQQRGMSTTEFRWCPRWQRKATENRRTMTVTKLKEIVVF
jgi:hypothetical protein